MSLTIVGPGEPDELDPTDGWGDVPDEDRPLWSRYMLDHLPWFPGITVMSFIAPGVVNGGTRAPRIWKDTARAVHAAGFTPIQYYLLAELLKEARERGDLNESAHGYLFEEWFTENRGPVTFRLAPEAWRPWLDRLESAESPHRALQHMLRGEELPPIAMLISSSGEVERVTND